ncbi:MAG TPA: TetR/AcrR family transcriptional regulator [Woeseiaceae bacterium]|nr:TetR/AcrR family transcriptional regulator [Woeseiaceae bacterium]
MSEESQNNRYEQQKLSAVKAAAAEFAEHGYHGASTKAIAARMGVQQGSLYYYFKSKEDALLAVCLFGIRDYASRMREIAANAQPFEAKLLATISSHLSSYRSTNEALKVYNAERLYLSAEKRANLKELGSMYRELLESIFDEAIRDAAIHDNVDCHFAAQTVIGMCNAWGELIVRDPELDIFELTQKCTNLLLRGFGK